MDKRYAIVSRVRTQVSSFSDTTKPFNPFNHIFVDLTDHLQKDEVQVDWFYDEVENTFSAEGEIPYPEPEIAQPTNTELLEEIEVTKTTTKEINDQNQTLMLAMIDQYEEQLNLQDNQVSTLDNQEIIMLALSDLYELILMNEGSE